MSHRCHWYENVAGAGVHAPFDTSISSPTSGVPLILGLTVFRGPFRDATTSLGADGARSRPSAFDAVTTTRTVRPTSAAASV